MLAPIHSRSHIITPAGLRDYAGAAERTAATAVRARREGGTSRRKSSSAAISDTIESLNTYLQQCTHAGSTAVLRYALGSARSARCPCALTQCDSAA